jgi:hypothetical protein
VPAADRDGGHADEVAGACGELWRYMGILEAMVAEPVAVAGGATPAMHGRLASPPLPGHQQALYALMNAHDGLRRLEATVRARASLPDRGKRPGTTASVARIVAELPRLAAAINDDSREEALYWLGQWITGAKEVHGVDEARRWRPLPRPRPGEERPPACPYCATYQLRADVEARVVACTNPRCPGDKNGAPPVASMATGPDGRSGLYWADGTEEAGVEGSLL